MFDLFSEIAISRRTAVWRRNRVGISYKCRKAIELPQRPAMGAGIDLLINGDRNDVETRVLFASDVMPHFA